MVVVLVVSWVCCFELLAGNLGSCCVAAFAWWVLDTVICLSAVALVSGAWFIVC